MFQESPQASGGGGTVVGALVHARKERPLRGLASVDMSGDRALPARFGGSNDGLNSYQLPQETPRAKPEHVLMPVTRRRSQRAAPSTTMSQLALHLNSRHSTCIVRDDAFSSRM